jgi:hypothetical protein
LKESFRRAGNETTGIPSLIRKINISIQMNDSDLDKLLRSAGKEEPLPASFKRSVWQRIESESVGRFRLREWVEIVLFPLTKPVTAAATVLAMTLLGLGLGAKGFSDSENLKAAYVESVSPFKGAHD